MSANDVLLVVLGGTMVVEHGGGTMGEDEAAWSEQLATRKADTVLTAWL